MQDRSKACFFCPTFVSGFLDGAAAEGNHGLLGLLQADALVSVGQIEQQSVELTHPNKLGLQAVATGPPLAEKKINGTVNWQIIKSLSQSSSCSKSAKDLDLPYSASDIFGMFSQRTTKILLSSGKGSKIMSSMARGTNLECKSNTSSRTITEVKLLGLNQFLDG